MKEIYHEVLLNATKKITYQKIFIISIMSLEKEKDLFLGQLVITEKDVFGLEEKWFFNEDYKTKTIYIDDNILIPKHNIGIIVKFINNWVVPAVVVCWGGELKNKNLVITLNKATLLDKFIEKLDNE
jgi:hypothetical protein